MKNQNNNFISVNLHITNACNYECKFCFAHFNNESKILRYQDWKKIIDLLYEAGTQKINFVGGEPLLHPDLGELLKYTSELGIVTSIVTNGSLLNQKFIEIYGNYLEWIGFSIDSFNESTEKELGRRFKNRNSHCHIKHIMAMLPHLREKGIKIKINSVITRLNWLEDMRKPIATIKPSRWKVFQVLPIKGENDMYIGDLEITLDQFNNFIEKHKESNPINESNKDMVGSYIMVDPLGRFFDNVTGSLVYSGPIQEIGLKKAFNEITFSIDKLVKRKGIYNW